MFGKKKARILLKVNSPRYVKPNILEQIPGRKEKETKGMFLYLDIYPAHYEAKI